MSTSIYFDTRILELQNPAAVEFYDERAGSVFAKDPGESWIEVHTSNDSGTWQISKDRRNSESKGLHVVKLAEQQVDTSVVSKTRNEGTSLPHTTSAAGRIDDAVLLDAYAKVC